MLLLIEITGQILGNETIEQHAQNVTFEVPAVHATPQIIGNASDGLMELRALGFLTVVH